MVYTALEVIAQRAMAIYQKHGASRDLAKIMATVFPVGYTPEGSVTERRVMASSSEDFIKLAYDELVNGCVAEARSYINTARGIDEVGRDLSNAASNRHEIYENLEHVLYVIRSSKKGIIALLKS